MKNLFVGFLLLLCSLSAQSQSQTFEKTIPIVCGSSEVMGYLIKDYDEQVLWTSDPAAGPASANQELQGFVFTASPGMKSWTMFLILNDDSVCMVVAGTEGKLFESR